jgi:hypothetical protein
MHSVPTQGETVNLSYKGALSNVTSVAIGIYDANGLLRTLQSYERLIIDELTLATTDNTGNLVYVLNVAAGATSATQATTIGTLGGVYGVEPLDVSGKEGKSLPVGITPSLLTSGPAGGLTYGFQGTGRIVAQDYQGQKSWQCAPSRAFY